MAGVSTPEGEVTLDPFYDLVRKNVQIQGVWVSDTSHLLRSIRMVEAGGFPFEKLIDHRCPLDQATTALELMRDRKVMKAVLVP